MKRLGIFKEEGMTLKVEIIAIKRTRKNWEDTTLKVLEIMGYSTHVKREAHPQVGETFMVGMNIENPAYAGWYLQEAQ
jgi:hypothetical protein